MDKSILDKSDLQQICSFILSQEETTSQTGSHEERLEQAKMIAYEELDYISGGLLEQKIIEEALCKSFNAYGAIHTEIGMRLGARMMLQLLSKDGI